MDVQPSEQRTAHHVRRLRASVRDLQHALGVVASADRPPRPPRDAVLHDTATSEDPRSCVATNNERGMIQQLQRLEDVGVVVLGLEGVGAMVADSLCRYGVRRLVVGDMSVLSRGDLDYPTYYVHNLGLTRESHVAAVSTRVNPEIDVFALGVPLTNSAVVVESLRRMLVRPETSDEDEGAGLVGSDEDSANGGRGYGSDGSDEEDTSQRRLRLALQGEVYDINANTDEEDECCFSVAFICGKYPELAMALNELCCEFGVQLVYTTMGKNGLSGDTLSVVPGRSACLQCLEKRKMLKLGNNGSSELNQVTSEYRISLPTTECVLAGIAVQHALAHLLGAGSVCSRVEYDGVREEFDRSGFVAPVHQCPSANCRLQQQLHVLSDN